MKIWLRTVSLLAVTLCTLTVATDAFARNNRGGGNGGGRDKAPEIDPAALTGAIALLSGSAMVLRGRRDRDAGKPTRE
jgi:hypothetical protein